MRLFLQQLFVALLCLITLITSPYLIYLLHITSTKNFDYFSASLIVAIAGGFLGGGIYMARGFYQSVINAKEPFDFKRFAWWYIFRSILSGIGGAIAFLLIYLAVDVQQTFDNQVTFFVLGLLAGYNFTTTIDKKLGKITQNLIEQN